MTDFCQLGRSFKAIAIAAKENPDLVSKDVLTSNKLKELERMV